MKLAEWCDHDTVFARLTAADMSADAAERAAKLFQSTARQLAALGIALDASVIANWVPGRVEVFGKHTDYCGGPSVLAAAERGFAMLAAPRAESSIMVVDAVQHEVAQFAIDPTLTPQPGLWTNYPQTVACRLARNFGICQGTTIALASNLPRSAGMSSSSALVTTVFLALARINELELNEAFSEIIRSREDLAGYISTVENGMTFGPLGGDRGVGTFGGSEDHTAILCGRPEALVQYSFCPVRFERAISVASEYAFAIASSGVSAEKTGAAMGRYNYISLLAQSVVQEWQRTTGRNDSSLAAILASSANAESEVRAVLRNAATGTFSSEELTQRWQHFVREWAIIRALPDTINSGTIVRFGEAAAASHEAADRLLKNQTPETNWLAAAASDFGAFAASAFGAGFGGSVWALVKKAAAPQFVEEWAREYRAEFPASGSRAEFFAMRPGSPAVMWPA
jgi:galactokinase